MSVGFRVQAVTICIDYSDYLRLISANRRHFDRWIIVTVHNDRATQELCKELGIECCISRHLPSNGAGFDAAWNKASIINEGLSGLDPDCWAVILDSDVLLPRNFRERIFKLPLVSGHLYGAKGR